MIFELLESWTKDSKDVQNFLIVVYGFIIGGAYFGFLLYKIKGRKFEAKVAERVSGEVERIGQFSSGFRNQNSFVIHLKGHQEPYYAHPNFGQSIYLPSRFFEMSKQLSLTKEGDLVELGISPLTINDGKAQQIILEFKNQGLRI